MAEVKYIVQLKAGNKWENAPEIKAEGIEVLCDEMEGRYGAMIRHHINAFSEAK